MAEVQESPISQGIKLFGATIQIQEKQAKTTHQPTNKVVVDDDDDGDDNDQEKRPDKIIPCPRCKSMETKFCYFNNYNVNQPRHFCKGCQRYWTAGGALRNVPVGAGRRKASHHAGPARMATWLTVVIYLMWLISLTLMDQWWLMKINGIFFPAAKRRRSTSDSQSY